MSIYAIHKQAAPPSGISHCISARLTPSCLLSEDGPSSSRSRITRNLVTARSNYLRIFEVVEELRERESHAAAAPDVRLNGESTRIDGSPEDEAHSQVSKP